MAKWKPPAKGATAGALPVSKGPGGAVAVPPITELGDDVRICPTFLAMGKSGSGKTEGARHLLESGITALVVAVEGKVQRLLAYRPLTIFMGEPLEVGGQRRRPTFTEMYQRLWAFKDRLGAGEYREHKGRPFEVIIIDGLMEVAKVFARHHKSAVPVSKSTGERNTYAMAESIGNEVLDFVDALRDAASVMSQMLSIAPVGIYTTCGIKAEKNKLGDVTGWKPSIYGNIAPDNLPYQFETILHLYRQKDAESGEVVYCMDTVGDDEQGLLAKVPSGLFPPVVMGWNMAEVYRRVMEDYAVRRGSGDAGAVAVKEAGPARVRIQ